MKPLVSLCPQVNELSEHFSESFAVFERARLFIGPSVYFHEKTSALLRKHRQAEEALDDLDFAGKIPPPAPLQKPEARRFLKRGDQMAVNPVFSCYY